MRLLIACHPFDQQGLGLRRRLAAAGYELLEPFADWRPSPEEVRAHLPAADALLVSTIPLGREVLSEAPRLRMISRNGVGTDNLDLSACRDMGLRVTWTPGANAHAVAELTLGYLIDLVRDLQGATARLRAGEWSRPLHRGLREQTVGILGFGNVGRRLAELLLPFRGTVLAHDIVEDAVEAEQRRVRYVTRDELLARSDLLTLHVPLTPQTHHLVNAETLAALPEGAGVVNTSRGPVVEEAALLAALDSGHLRGAALDVYEEEPYSGPLARHPRVRLTAHEAACTHEARAAMDEAATEELLRFARGEAPRNDALRD